MQKEGFKRSQTGDALELDLVRLEYTQTKQLEVSDTLDNMA